MYVEIFKAEIALLDASYFSMAKQMRERAMNVYGCRDFISLSDETHEIAISYWDNDEAIAHWHNDEAHSVAQEYGKSRWYKSYKVEICQIVREYN